MTWMEFLTFCLVISGLTERNFWTNRRAKAVPFVNFILTKQKIYVNKSLTK